MCELSFWFQYFSFVIFYFVAFFRGIFISSYLLRSKQLNCIFIILAEVLFFLQYFCIYYIRFFCILFIQVFFSILFLSHNLFYYIYTLSQIFCVMLLPWIWIMIKMEFLLIFHVSEYQSLSLRLSHNYKVYFDFITHIVSLNLYSYRVIRWILWGWTVNTHTHTHTEIYIYIKVHPNCLRLVLIQ